MVQNREHNIANPGLVVGRSTGLLIAVVAVILGALLGGAVWVAHTRSTRSQLPVMLTAEERAYLQHIVVADAQVSAAANFLGDMVTYVDARMTNTGWKPVRQLDVQLEFSDMLNQVVLRETTHPLTPRMPPLAPGETRAFRTTLERMPAEWNQAPPAITPSLSETAGSIGLLVYSCKASPLRILLGTHIASPCRLNVLSSVPFKRSTGTERPASGTGVSPSFSQINRVRRSKVQV